MRVLKIGFIFVLAFLIISCADDAEEKFAKEIVYKHAKAWETGDYVLFNSIMHKDVIFAYPGRRMNKDEAIKDFIEYNKSFTNTKVYINKIIADDDNLAVEWQFASTNIKTGNRTAVSDAIIGKIKDGKIIVWKEYLDGRVGRMQAAGNLSLEEGEEPFPWPKKN